MSDCSIDTQLALLFKKSKSIEQLQKEGINSIGDLLQIMPSRVIFYPLDESFSSAQIGKSFKSKGKIASIHSKNQFWNKRRRGPLLCNITVIVREKESNETILLQWFNTYPTVLKKLKTMTQIEFAGIVGEYRGTKQIINPRFVNPDISSGDERLPVVEVKYRPIGDVKSRFIFDLFKKIPEKILKNILDPIPDCFLKKHQLPMRGETFLLLHGKKDFMTEVDLEIAKKRLIYENFLFEHLKAHIRKLTIKNTIAPVIKIDDETFEKFFSIFSFELTKDQKKALYDIRHDLEVGNPMLRLVQGDVGCGKTAVALISSLIAISQKKQVAILCPTESLAHQHYLEISEKLKEYSVSFLTASVKAKEKKEILNRLENKEVDLIIGTHSLLSDSVVFNDLALVIIDEQHKFGVKQRLSIVEKSKGKHTLLMTATPIPRSLSLTKYGDLDLSIVKEMPAGKKEIKTRIVSEENFSKYLEFIRSRLNRKEQAYVVVSAIDDDEEEKIDSLNEILNKYQQFFPDKKIVSLHGRMKGELKNSIFNQFLNKEIDILISTSVIEVGINIPNSTSISIYNPERFGLSSLHQFRGRVGRAGMPGFCFLITNNQTTPEAIERLEIFEKTNDGLTLAEADLKNRGHGDLYGVEQSGGVGNDLISALITHQDLFIESKKDLEEITSKYHENYELMSKMLKTPDKVFLTI